MAKKTKKGTLPSHPDFPEKYAKCLPDTWVPAAEDMDKKALEEEIVKCEIVVESTEKDVADDAKVQQLKEDLKYLTEGYKEILKTQKAKIKFSLYLMASRGYI